MKYRGFKHCVSWTPNLIIAVITALVLLAGFFPVPQSVAADDEESLNLTQADLPAKGNPKLDSTLNRLVSTKAAPGPGRGPVISDNTSPPEAMIMEATPESANETVRVIIEGEPGKAEKISSAAGEFGSVEGSYGDLVQVVVPVSQLAALAEMQDVRFVRLPMQPLPAVTSEGVSRINADDWQLASYNGTGVKIGILDVGFSDYTVRQSEVELPASIVTWWAPSIGNEGTNIHGTACAEIVYDIAPGATYYFANFGTDVEYGNAVDWLISQGVDVISCSVGWPGGGPGDGTGFFCQVVDSARAAGVFWAQAAGNQARRHWQGDWYNPDHDVWLNFSGSDEGNSISVSDGDPIVVSLKWDDPWGSSGNDYDLVLIDNTPNIVAASTNIQNGDDDPYEFLAYQATYTGTYYIAVLTLSNPDPVNFHLYTYYQDLQYRTAADSLIVPADSFSCITAGAVYYGTPDTLEPFSSCGPTDDGRVKPDLVAPDGVSTVTYGTENFFGTSAAAPHTAGAAALVKQRFPTYSPTQIQDFLEGRAQDLDPAGKDNYYGSGRLDLGIASDNYTLTMSMSGNGSLMPAAGSHIYTAGTVVSVNATPDIGWEFTSWTGNVADPLSANTSVTMDMDKNITANFNQATGNSTLLTISVSGSGSTTPATGSHSYPLDHTVNLTANASANWEFVNWTGDVSDNLSASTNVTMDTNKTIIANFVRTDSILRMAVSGNGSVTPGLGNHIYPIDTSVNITATPSSGWRFAGWIGDVADAYAASTNVTLEWDKTVIAIFDMPVLTMSVSGSGSVMPGVGEHVYTMGTSVNITASPLAGWKFVHWTGNIDTVANVNSSSTNITMNDDYSVTAVFSRISSGGGGGGGGGGGSVNGKANTSLRSFLSSEGVLLEDVQAFSDDLKARLDIPRGTKVKNRVGANLASVSITRIGEPDEPQPGSTIIGEVYELGPTGATFDPPIKLTIRYKDDDLTGGITEAMLSLVAWDDTTKTYLPIDCQIDIDNNEISAYISHFSRYTILATPQPARFTLSDLTISPSRVNPGEKVVITVTVANTGSLSGNYTASLYVNNSVEETKTVTAAGGEEVTLSFEVVAKDIGTLNVRIGSSEGSFVVEGTLADFEIGSLEISPPELDTGQTADISVTVTNTGQSPGTYGVEFNVNGAIVATKEVSLAGGESQKVSFSLEADTAGKKLIDVNGLIGALIVRGEVPPPEQIPLPLEEPGIAPTPEPAAPETSLPAEEPGPSGTNWVMIGGIAGGCLVLAVCASYLTWRRKRVR
jgi:hypothetical protein